MLHFLVQPQRELQLYLKTNNNWDCQKTELYESLNNQSFKEATFIQTGRRGGAAEMGREAWRHGCMV